MQWLIKTTRFSRGILPHWEIEGGRYFVTVRCHDSLPLEAVARLAEIHEALKVIEPRSEQFSALQRRYFLTTEKYLHAGHGRPWLAHPIAARTLVEELAALRSAGVEARHFSIMPNHFHALLASTSEGSINLHDLLGVLKGRSSRRINLALGRAGPLWQREWFDRWMRNDAEWDKCADYIRQNPVKAGLVQHWQDHPWTK